MLLEIEHLAESADATLAAAGRVMETTTPLCPRCGYDRDRDEERKRLLGHIGHRLRTMLYIAAGDEGLIWICEWCHAGEQVLGAERRTAWRAA